MNNLEGFKVQNMEKESNLICPYPRTRKACDNCRSRKSRCLPDAKCTSQGQCRRCAKLGLDCVFRDAHKPKHKLTSSMDSSNIFKSTRKSHGNDMVSQLFQFVPDKEDEWKLVREKHRCVFREQFNVDERSDIALSARERSAVHHMETLNTEPDIPNIDMQEADMFLSVFKKRRAYFPFITIPDTASSRQMAENAPFLLLSILTVCSAKRPRLQRRTEHRFRQVVNDRITVHQEKSLEYIQGLLVYLAWYPIHLYPTKPHHFDYLRTAIVMCRDLEMSKSPGASAGWNACLGCYYLSSLFSTFRDQHVDLDAQIFSQEALPDYISSDLLEDASVQYATMHRLLGEISLRKMEINRRQDLTENPIDCLERDVDSFSEKLLELELKISPELANTVQNQLSRQFMRVQISSLAMRRFNRISKAKSPGGSIKYSVSTTFHCLGIENADRCFNELQALFETFLAVPVSEYDNFSIREWLELIFAFVTASRICLGTDSAGEFDLAPFHIRARAKMLIYIESLTHRMMVLSASDDACPDIYGMFRSVLEILTPLYTPKSSMLTDNPPSSYHNGTSSSSYHTEDNISTPGTSSSRCPIASGEIKETEFWGALNDQGLWCHFDSPTLQEKPHVEAPQDASMNYVPPPSPNWATIFSEWVVDLNQTE